MRVDENGKPYNSLDSFDVLKTSLGDFAGGTAGARGNDGGADDPLTIFTVTGEVEVGIFGVCSSNLAGANATLEVGVTGNTAGLIAQTTGTDIDANEVWLAAAPANVGIEVIDSLSFFFVVNGLDIIETIATSDVTSGGLEYILLWRPLSPGSTVVL